MVINSIVIIFWLLEVLLFLHEFVELNELHPHLV